MLLVSDILFWGTLPWIVLLISIFFVVRNHFDEDSKIKILFWLVFIFASLRYGIGYDYYSYKEVINGDSPEWAFDRWEFLPRTLAAICRPYHYQLFFAVTSFIITYSIYYVVKKSAHDKVASYLIFIFYPQYYLISLGTIRNSVAYALIFLAFYLWYNNKKTKSLFFYALAIGFHSSAIFSGIVFLLPYMLKGKKSNIILYLFSLVGSVVFLPVIHYLFENNAQVEYYLLNADHFSGGALFLIIVNLVAILNLIYWDRLSTNNDMNKYYLTTINIGVLIYNLTIVVSSVFATRLFSYYWYFLILLLPSYPHASKNLISKQMIYWFCILLFLFTFAMQYNNFINQGIRMSNLPYQFFFYHTDFFYNLY